MSDAADLTRALTALTDAAAERHLTRRALRRATSAVARAIAASLRPGDRVTITSAAGLVTYALTRVRWAGSQGPGWPTVGSDPAPVLTRDHRCLYDPRVAWFDGRNMQNPEGHPWPIGAEDEHEECPLPGMADLVAFAAEVETVMDAFAALLAEQARACVAATRTLDEVNAPKADA